MNITRITSSSFFIGLSYFLWVFFIHINGSQYLVLYNLNLSVTRYLNVIVLLCLFLYIIIGFKIDGSTKIDLALFLVFFVGFLTFQRGALIFLFIILARRLKFSSFIKVFILATLFGMGFVFATYALDLYPITDLNLFREDGSYRYLLGYRFPTFMPNFYFHLVLCWIFLRQDKSNLCEYIGILLINFLLYYFTDTRAVFYLLNFLVISALMIRYINYDTCVIGWIFKFFTKYSIFIFCFIAFYFQYNYDPSVDYMNNLDSILSGRLHLGKMGFDLYDINLFGNNVEFVTLLESALEKKQFFYIDSAYIQLILIYGVLLTVLVLLGYMRIGINIVENNDKYFGLVLIFLFAHSMTDPQLLSPEFNPFLLCLGYYGLKKHKDNLFK
ncbi:hypothetical protein JP29_00340 [Gallibacterium anatis]|nr:hypothetical protein JP29_00340 [Gallibacterium anatis]